jgi:hypothetical protein
MLDYAVPFKRRLLINLERDSRRITSVGEALQDKCERTMFLGTSRTSQGTMCNFPAQLCAPASNALANYFADSTH